MGTPVVVRAGGGLRGRGRPGQTASDPATAPGRFVMARVSRFTPLDRIPAVVLDTETTGLDVATCRVVQVSAVRFTDGAAVHDQVFDRLVNSGVAIPPQSTAVHGISDAMVAGAASFAEVKSELDRFAGDSVLVGQSIGFDLAVLRNETQRIGAEWVAPQFLDTKLLAAALHPDGRELGLDELAAWLGVPIADRHHALGDALVTAAVFAHLIPRLTAAGIRTLGDAEARSNAQTRIRARQAEAGWYDATSVRPQDPYESGRDASALARLERLAYRHRVEHLMDRAPAIVAPATTLADLVRLMADGTRRAILAGDAASGRVDGIVTKRDVVTALARGGAAVLSSRIETLMTAPVVTVPHDAFVYRALARMQRLGVGQLPIVDSARRVVGMLSLRDLLRDDAGDAAAIGDRLSTAPTPRALAGACAELPALAGRLLADGVPAGEVAAVLAAELRELLARAAMLAEKRMASEGSGRPPVPYAVLALGRSGRGECSLAPDIEHALVFSSGEPDSLEARWFEVFAAHLADCLRLAGAPPAAGAARADDPAWRRSLEGWRAEIQAWAAEPHAAAAPAAAFFDFRLAYGDEDLVEDLRALALELGAGAPALVRALAPQPAAIPPAPAADSRVNVAAGLAPIEALGRTLAVATRLRALATGERLAEACRLSGLSRATADDLTEIHERLFGLLLTEQQRDLAAGRPASFAVDIARLDPADRAALGVATERTANLRDVVRMALALVA